MNVPNLSFERLAIFLQQSGEKWMLVQCSSLSLLDTSMQQPIISTLCLATFYANSISATWEVLKVLAWSYKKRRSSQRKYPFFCYCIELCMRCIFMEDFQRQRLVFDSFLQFFLIHKLLTKKKIDKEQVFILETHYRCFFIKLFHTRYSF